MNNFNYTIYILTFLSVSSIICLPSKKLRDSWGLILIIACTRFNTKFRGFLASTEAAIRQRISIAIKNDSQLTRIIRQFTIKWPRRIIKVTVHQRQPQASRAAGGRAFTRSNAYFCALLNTATYETRAVARIIRQTKISFISERSPFLKSRTKNSHFGRCNLPLAQHVKLVGCTLLLQISPQRNFFSTILRIILDI